MLNRDDVERIIENVLSKLSIDVEDGLWSSSKIILLKLDGRILSRTCFDVAQNPEYKD